jgi:outer membrane receptor protein involved in Fe transport
MNSALYRFLTLIAVLSLVATGMLYGQTAVTGAISGSVSDASAAAISDATVEATNTADNVTTSTVSNKDGLYRFPSLIPGTYKITIKKQGFAVFTREATRLDAGFALRIDASLPIGTVTTKVDVTDEAPLVQTDSAEVNQTMGATEVKALPTFGRNITRLSLLAPGAFMASGQLDLHPENAGEDFNLNVNGGQPNNNSHTLDGVDNTEKIQGLTLIVTTQDSVQEVKMTTSNYDAEYGKVSGGLFQVTTKSGTNDFHGSLFEYYRTAGFFAADQFTQHLSGVPSNRWNQFGGSVGGPIIKDKLFFFGDYQGMRNNLHTSGSNTVPLDAFRQGDFSSIAATDPIYDPATGNPDGTGRTQFDCDGILNKICPDRISPAATNLLALLPEPNVPGALNQNYQVSRPAVFNQNQFNTRVDYFVTPKTVVFGKFSYFNAKFFTDNAYGPVAGGPPLGGAVNSGNSSDHDKSAMVDYQHTFSPSLLTDARFAFSRIIISELQLDSNLDTATTVGIPNINLGTVYTSGLPQFSISDPVSAFAMGDFGLPFFEREADFQFYNNWTKTVGRHAFKFGGDVEKFFGIRTDVSGRGAFNFAQSLTGLNESCAPLPACPTNGSGLAAFELGLSSGFGRDITLVQPQEKQWRWAFYGQDNWRVTPTLTLMLGLRWDYSTPIFTPDGQSVGNLDLNTGNVLLTNLAGKYAGVTTSKTEFSPRIGVSYKVMKDTVLRGGFGRSYFNNPDGAGFGTQGCCFPIKESQSDTQANPFAALPYTLDQGPGLPAPLPPFPANGQLPLGNLSDIFPGVGPYPHSYNDSYNVTLEHALPHEITMSVAYVGNHGRHLWDNVDVNAPVPGPNVGGTFNPNRPYFARFGWTNSETQRNNQLAGYPEMKSNYNSLQARVQKRFHSGLYLMSNFTWDKSLDLGTFGPQNIFDFASNYGNSDATRPWAWISAFNWELPFGRGRMFANSLSRGADAVVGGWAFSGIVNLEAGQYFTPTLADNSSLNSTIALRPDRIGSGSVSHQNRFEWFNPNDFVTPAQFVYGDSGRNILLGPGFDSLDLSLTKILAVTERVHLEIKWDAFNALNHENLANPNASISPGVADSPAGTINGIVDFRRRMQIGAHLTF